MLLCGGHELLTDTMHVCLLLCFVSIVLTYKKTDVNTFEDFKSFFQLFVSILYKFHQVFLCKNNFMDFYVS